jgi:hypothetical protein
MMMGYYWELLSDSMMENMKEFLMVIVMVNWKEE